MNMTGDDHGNDDSDQPLETITRTPTMAIETLPSPNMGLEPTVPTMSLPVDLTAPQQQMNIYAAHSQRMRKLRSREVDNAAHTHQPSIISCTPPKSTTALFPPHWKLSIVYSVQGGVCFTMNRPHNSYQVVRRIDLSDISLSAPFSPPLFKPLVYRPLPHSLLQYDSTMGLIHYLFNLNTNGSATTYPPSQKFNHYFQLWQTTCACFDHECITLAKKSKQQQYHPNCQNFAPANNHSTTPGLLNHNVKYSLFNPRYVDFM